MNFEEIHKIMLQICNKGCCYCCCSNVVLNSYGLLGGAHGWVQRNSFHGTQAFLSGE